MLDDQGADMPNPATTSPSSTGEMPTGSPTSSAHSAWPSAQSVAAATRRSNRRRSVARVLECVCLLGVAGFGVACVLDFGFGLNVDLLARVSAGCILAGLLSLLL